MLACISVARFNVKTEQFDPSLRFLTLYPKLQASAFIERKSCYYS